MILKCLDGPMDGAVYELSRERPEPSTTRKPDGFWFDGQDESNNWGRHRYQFDKHAEQASHIVLCYRYVGFVDGPMEDLAASGGIGDGR